MSNSTKHVVFIVSAGRTGTTFFGERLSEIISGAYSVHEPDVVEGLSRVTWNRIRTFGWYHMIFGRLLGQTGIRNLSRKYLASGVSRDDLIAAVIRHRDSYYSSISADLIVESYAQWFGLLPVLSEVYPNHKVIGLTRDPRTWVASVMNYGTQFGSRDWVTKLGFQRLSPRLLGDAEYIERWSDMSAFERNCWHWKTIYSLIHRHERASSNARIFRYEDLFLARDRITRLREMLAFITRFPDRQFAYELKGDILDTRSRASQKTVLPEWHKWDQRRARQLHSICGPMMEKFEYGKEPEWRELAG